MAKLWTGVYHPDAINAPFFRPRPTTWKTTVTLWKNRYFQMWPDAVEQSRRTESVDPEHRFGQSGFGKTTRFARPRNHMGQRSGPEGGHGISLIHADEEIKTTHGPWTRKKWRNHSFFGKLGGRAASRRPFRAPALVPTAHRTATVRQTVDRGRGELEKNPKKRGMDGRMDGR
ncbi:uncharacterized protein J3R85_000541 [Psidium guajava]|nr:uncharacterized protein J3R85_000541 [Psidium guajava]